MAGGIALACGLGPVGIVVATVSVALIGSAALGRKFNIELQFSGR